jgi:hypothetical protein
MVSVMSADVIVLPVHDLARCRKSDAAAEEAAQRRLITACNLLRSFESNGYGAGNAVEIIARTAEVILQEIREKAWRQ